MNPDELEATRNIVRLVSFDIKGFSPNQSPEVRRSQLASWAEVFGIDNITALDKIFTGSKVHLIKKGFHLSYTLNGNDLEGYLGRMNTDFHIDVMGYAVRKLREREVLQLGAKLAVQIDDGALQLRFPPGTPHHTQIAALEYIEAVYKYFSMEISWDKTYVSGRMYVFLNELFVDGRRMTPGVKAFLRIRHTERSEISNFLRDHNKVISMVSGALKAGAPGHVLYMRYAMELGARIQKWRGRVTFTSDEAVLIAVTPVAFGGLGAVSLLQLSANITDHAVTTSLGHMKALAFNDRFTVETIDKILNRPIKERSPLAILRAADSFSVEGPTLTDTKEQTYAEAALRSRVKNPLVAAAFETSTDSIEEWVAANFLEGNAAPRSTVDKVYAMTGLKSIDTIVAKFTRARTILTLLGFKRAAVLYKAYLREFAEVCKAMISTMK